MAWRVFEWGVAATMVLIGLYLLGTAVAWMPWYWRVSRRQGGWVRRWDVVDLAGIIAFLLGAGWTWVALGVLAGLRGFGH